MKVDKKHICFLFHLTVGLAVASEGSIATRTVVTGELFPAEEQEI